MPNVLRYLWRGWCTAVMFTVPIVFFLHLADLAAHYDFGALSIVLGIGGFATASSLCWWLWDKWAESDPW